MARLLVAGLCPLPFEATPQSFGPGIRSWQLAWSLAHAGHEVRLLAFEIPGVYGEDPPRLREQRDGVDIVRLLGVHPSERSHIEPLVVEFRPDALVGATIYGSSVLAPLAAERPFWADQFGHVMAEAQAKARLERANWPLPYFWRLVAPVMRRADRVSTVSDRQRYAAIGELGALGRLNWETCGHDLVATIPCAALPAVAGSAPAPLRGQRLPADAFVVLWSGGFNVWTDVETLHLGLERAMRDDRRIHFVSTGGAIKGQDETGYHRFAARVEASSLRERFHLLGWRPAQEIPGYVAAADVGVVTDLPIYEGLLGSKNRVVQWMAAGLPVAYNRIGDLGDLVSEQGLGLAFELGDAVGLAGRLSWAAQHPSELRELARRAQAYVRRELSFEVTTRPLVEWAARPERAPDAATSVTSPLDYEPWHVREARERRLDWVWKYVQPLRPAVRLARRILGVRT